MAAPGVAGEKGVGALKPATPALMDAGQPTFDFLQSLFLLQSSFLMSQAM